MAIGAYLPDAPFQLNVLTAYAEAIRRMPDFLVWYAAWSDGEFGEEQWSNLQLLDSWGTVPVIAWDPMEHLGHPIDQPE